MTAFHQFRKGDVLFEQGDASDRVLWVCQGEVEIWREVGTTSVLLGHVRAGEWLGEMGIIENRRRSATARAGTDVEAEILSARQFLDRVSSDPALARALLLRLSIRLREIEDKVTEDLVSFTAKRLPETPAWDADFPAPGTISITAQTDMLRAQMGAAPMQIVDFPYVVGRVPVAGEAKPPRHPDLPIEDNAPFRLSRNHFMITRSGDQLLVSDLGSALGTIVNGEAIGYHFRGDVAPLHRGQNHILAGGWGSPFDFILSSG